MMTARLKSGKDTTSMTAKDCKSSAGVEGAEDLCVCLNSSSLFAETELTEAACSSHLCGGTDRSRKVVRALVLPFIASVTAVPESLGTH